MNSPEFGEWEIGKMKQIKTFRALSLCSCDIRTTKPPKSSCITLNLENRRTQFAYGKQTFAELCFELQSELYYYAIRSCRPDPFRFGKCKNENKNCVHVHSAFVLFFHFRRKTSIRVFQFESIAKLFVCPPLASDICFHLKIVSYSLSQLFVRFDFAQINSLRIATWSD